MIEEQLALFDTTRDVRHNAQYSTEIIAALARFVPPIEGRIHDPFAGTGVRLGQLCDRLGLTFTGTEIEQSFIVDQRVAHDDSTVPATYPTMARIPIGIRTRSSRHRPTATG